MPYYTFPNSNNQNPTLSNLLFAQLFKKQREQVQGPQQKIAKYFFFGNVGMSF